MATISGDQVLQAFRQDPAAATMDLSVIEPFVVALPEILADLLDQKVTFEDFIEAKRRYMLTCLDRKLIERAAGGRAPKFVITKLKEIYEAQLAQYEQLCQPGYLAHLLKSCQVTGNDLLRTSKYGFGDFALALLDAGTLTFGDLLLIQPGVIIVNEP